MKQQNIISVVTIIILALVSSASYARAMPVEREMEAPVEDAETPITKGGFCYVKGPKKSFPNAEIKLTLFTNVKNPVIKWSSVGTGILLTAGHETKKATFQLGSDFKGGKITAWADGYEDCHSTHAIELQEKDPTYGATIGMKYDSSIPYGSDIVLLTGRGKVDCDTETLPLMCFVDADIEFPSVLDGHSRSEWSGGVATVEFVKRDRIKTLQDADAYCSDGWSNPRRRVYRSGDGRYAILGDSSPSSSKGLFEGGPDTPACWAH